MAQDPSSDQQPGTVDGAGPGLTRRVFVPAIATAVAASALAGAVSAESEQATSSTGAGAIWWNELRTRDATRARAFYAAVVGWTPKVVAQDDMGRAPAEGEKAYTLFTMRGHEVAGAEEIAADEQAGRPAGWLAYIQVEDVDEAARNAAKHGGKVVQQPVDVAGVGRMAEVEDPEGNRIGLVSPRA
jgi:predicted enzyme related to lactoylglutathione lyase